MSPFVSPPHPSHCSRMTRNDFEDNILAIVHDSTTTFLHVDTSILHVHVFLMLSQS